MQVPGWTKLIGLALTIAAGGAWIARAEDAHKDAKTVQQTVADLAKIHTVDSAVREALAVRDAQVREQIRKDCAEGRLQGELCEQLLQPPAP
jgi:hypothetical protein